MRRVALVAAGIVVAAAVGSCGVSDNGSVERITPGLGLDDSAPTTTTTTTTTTVVSLSTLASVPAATSSTTPVQTENVLLWFISGALLNRITTSMPTPATLNQVLAALQRVPDGLPPATSMRTAVPAQSRLAATDNENGTATIDLPADFFNTIPNADQRRAIGQIVLTMTQRPGIGAVRFTSNGEDVAVVLGNGEQSARGQLVTRADYRALTEEAPLPTTTTTTISATTSAPETSVAEPTTLAG